MRKSLLCFAKMRNAVFRSCRNVRKFCICGEGGYFANLANGSFRLTKKNSHFRQKTLHMLLQKYCATFHFFVIGIHRNIISPFWHSVPFVFENRTSILENDIFVCINVIYFCCM